MDRHFVLQGLFIGFAVAAPVGTIGVLVIRRSLVDGASFGFATGMGAAFADAVFAAIAALGLGAVAKGLAPYELLLRSLGAIVVGLFGMRALTRSRATAQAPRAVPPTSTAHASAFAGTFALTIVNPMTIGSFVAIAASAGLGTRASSGLDAARLVSGVLAGSAAWWFFLSTATNIVRDRIPARAFGWIERASGVALIAFAGVALASAWGVTQ